MSTVAAEEVFLGLLGVWAVLLVLPLVLFLVGIWRIGTGLRQIAHALGYGENRTPLAHAAVRMTDHADALVDAHVKQATALEAQARALDRTAAAHEESVRHLEQP